MLISGLSISGNTSHGFLHYQFPTDAQTPRNIQPLTRFIIPHPQSDASCARHLRFWTPNSFLLPLSSPCCTSRARSGFTPKLRRSFQAAEPRTRSLPTRDPRTATGAPVRHRRETDTAPGFRSRSCQTAGHRGGFSLPSGGVRGGEAPGRAAPRSRGGAQSRPWLSETPADNAAPCRCLTGRGDHGAARLPSEGGSGRSEGSGGDRVGSGPAQPRFRRRRRCPARKCSQGPLPAAPRCAGRGARVIACAGRRRNRQASAGQPCHRGPRTVRHPSRTPRCPGDLSGLPHSRHGLPRPQTPHRCLLEQDRSCELPTRDSAGAQRSGCFPRRDSRPQRAGICRGTACPRTCKDQRFYPMGLTHAGRLCGTRQMGYPGWWICSRESPAQEQRCYRRDWNAQTSAAFISPWCYWLGRNTLWRAWIPWRCIMVSVSESY